MNYFFLRFLPYLYYFIKEQYRIDNQSAPPTRKKRYFYRTVIASLVILLGLLLTGGVVKYRQFSHDLKEAEKVIEKLKSDVEQNRGISRQRYEDDLRGIAMEKFGWENDSRQLENEIIRQCKDKPASCDERTRHIIEDFERKHPR